LAMYTKRCEIRIQVALSNMILSFPHAIQRIREIVGAIDALCAVEIVAVEVDCVRPRLVDGGD